MSSVSYSIKYKGARIVSAEKAWKVGKNGKRRLNTEDYFFIGRFDARLPTFIVTASDKSKPKYRGSVHDLCSPAKEQLVDHFFDDKGRRNKNRVAYLIVDKKKRSKK